MNTIYFDNSATTPVCPAAREALLRVLDSIPGNPSSLHALGAAAERELTAARMSVLSALGSDRFRGRLVFTGCGSEANNLAVLGAARAKKFRGTPRLITTDSEHPSILRQAELLSSAGWDVVRIPTRGGALDTDAFDAALTPETVIISLMLVNNETGAVYDVASAFAKARRRVPAALLHCDAIQGFLKIPFSVHRLGCDALSVSAHKVGAPKGVGALWFSPELERRRALSPVIYGGGQEAGLRSGTENVAGIAAFGAAVRENAAGIAEFSETTSALSRQIVELLTAANAGIRFNLPPVRAPHILSITNPRVRSETLVHFLSARGICVSAGSACSSHAKKPESALPAFGLTEKETGRTVRVSLSSDNTAEEVAVFCSAFLEGIQTLAGEA
ncbi:MAG: cysteine desulfurase family protein [Eubacteriales bacterium]|nr:cysteine desulfurase family protein [Eubacteriales bacterium]